MLAKYADVPIAKDAASRFLPWLVAFMVYLAALALTCTMAMQHMVDRWDRGLAGRVTVQVPPPPSDDAAGSQAQIDRVLTSLRETPGLRSVELLDQEQMAALLEPWLGDSVVDQNLPLPALIAVTLNESQAPPLADLRRSL
ncbi:MAG: cell division protein FtsX, partial [Kiloniellales bacterium]